MAQGAGAQAVAAAKPNKGVILAKSVEYIRYVSVSVYRSAVLDADITHARPTGICNSSLNCKRNAAQSSSAWSESYTAATAAILAKRDLIEPTPQRASMPRLSTAADLVPAPAQAMPEVQPIRAT